MFKNGNSKINLSDGLLNPFSISNDGDPTHIKQLYFDKYFKTLSRLDGTRRLRLSNDPLSFGLSNKNLSMV